MSRVGNKLIKLPQGVEISINEDNFVVVKGAKGELSFTFDKNIKINVNLI